MTIASHRQFRGFTLIELLIVVAIIGILAAIAVPNFMNAQIRARVSRAEADMRNLKTAIELYQIDHNNFPMARYSPLLGLSGQIPLSQRFYALTSPISYLGSIPQDPFWSQLSEQNPTFFDTYDYFDNWSGVNHDGGQPGAGTRGYSYRIASAGPDNLMTWGSPAASAGGCTGVDYHPSNGLISCGDIVTVGGSVVGSRWVVEYPLRQYPRW